MSGFSESVSKFVRLTGIEPLPIQRRMSAFAAENNFPIIGQEVGGFLCVLSHLVNAELVFEMGSGFGYSASWFARGMSDTGTVILTEYDEDELDYARDFFSDAEYDCRFVYENGDALTTASAYGGPFDIVLLDHEKSRYVDGFECVKEKLSPNGVVIADNMMYGPVAFEDVLEGVEDPSRIRDESTKGVIEYLQFVKDHPDFSSTVIPMGNGVSVSVKNQ